MTAQSGIATRLMAATTAAMNASVPADSLSVEDIGQLTAALARGDDQAFRQFHEAYFERLFRYLFVVTHGDEDAAREALQQTFIRMARHARRFDSEEVFWSWLTVLARSAAHDGCRRRERYWRALQRYAASLFSSDSAPAAGKEDYELLLAAMQRALRLMDSRERELLEQKYFQGVTVRELAQRAATSEKAIESRLTRARQSLRKLMSEDRKNEGTGKRTDR